MGELQAALEKMFDAFERKDVETFVGAVANEAQAVDEISRRWLRGGDEVRNYLRGDTWGGHRHQVRAQRRQRNHQR